MKYCPNCRVLIHGNPNRCPLCQNHTVEPPKEMQETAREDYPGYPSIPLHIQQMHLFLRILLMCSVSAGVICTILNMIFMESGLWCLFVWAGIACIWINLYFFIKKRKNLIKNMTYQLISAMILALLWDVFTGWRGWSIDFVLPIVTACALILLMILIPSLKIAITDVVLYVGTFIVISWICLVLRLTGCLHVILPTLICFGIGLIFLASLFIFSAKPIMAEIRRRFHV